MDSKFKLINQFKNHQIQFDDSIFPVFNGQHNLIKYSAVLPGNSSENLIDRIYFDQTERISCLIIQLEIPSNSSLTFEAGLIKKFGQVFRISQTHQLTSSGEYRIYVDEAEVRLCMGVVLFLNFLGHGTAKLDLSVGVYPNYFSQTIREFDLQGFLSAASKLNSTRHDATFDTENINSGQILNLLKNLADADPPKNPQELFPIFPSRKRNLLGEPITDGVTMFVHVMNRGENVINNLPNWLGQKFNELILLDWSSSEPVAEIPHVLDDPRVRVVRVYGQKIFVRTLAQNLAVQMARYNKVFKCDSDVLLKGEFFASHPLESGQFWVGDWHQARDSNERHLHGETYFNLDDFFRVGGYDERISSYGQDDTNLKDRMVLAGLIKKVFCYDQMHHVAHDNTVRASNQNIVHPMVNTYANRLAVNWNELWSPKLKPATYKIIKDDLRVITFELESRPQEIQTDQALEAAIEIVAGWYANKKALSNMSREEKIKLIWDRQTE